MQLRVIIATDLGADALDEWHVWLRWRAGNGCQTCLQSAESDTTLPSRDMPRLCMPKTELQKGWRLGKRGWAIEIAKTMLITKPSTRNRSRARSTLCCRQNSASSSAMARR